MSLYKKIVLSEPIRSVKFVSHALPPVPLKVAEKRADEAYRRGVSETTASLNQQIAEMHNDVSILQNKVLNDIQKQFATVLSNVSGRLPFLVIEMVRRVWGGLEVKPEEVEEIVREALHEISPNADKIEVALSPDAFAILDRFSANLTDMYPNLNFKEDPALKCGDCLVESKFGKINATINRKLERIEHEMIG